MKPEQIRRLLIGVIGVVMVAMAAGFVVYLVLGYREGNPEVLALLSGFGLIVILIVGLGWRIWLARRLYRGVRGGFMQGYRRKPNDRK